MDLIPTDGLCRALPNSKISIIKLNCLSVSERLTVPVCLFVFKSSLLSAGRLVRLLSAPHELTHCVCFSFSNKGFCAIKTRVTQVCGHCKVLHAQDVGALEFQTNLNIFF